MIPFKNIGQKRPCPVLIKKPDIESFKNIFQHCMAGKSELASISKVIIYIRISYKIRNIKNFAIDLITTAPFFESTDEKGLRFSFVISVMNLTLLIVFALGKLLRSIIQAELKA